MRTSALLGLSLVAFLVACSDGPDSTAPSSRNDSEPLATGRFSHSRPGVVYILSNNASANAVLVFQRGRDGRLGAPTATATGGRGTGADLANQGAIALGGGRLYAVNAGSNEISAFAVQGGSLRLLQGILSGGDQPISLALHDDLLYVLNDGAAANITGFRVRRDGRLSPIAGSTRARTAPPARDGAQISFSPDGHTLVVTEKAANLVVTYPVFKSGLTGNPILNQSSGPTPFGFGFARRGTLVVSEAAGGAPNASTVSSYTIDRDARLDPVSHSVSAGQTAACWVAVTSDGRLAYVTNTGSGTVSGFKVASRGTLTSISPDGVTGSTGAGSAPADLALSRGDQFLYVRNGGNRTISIFRIGKGGRLTLLDTVTGLPDGATGLAVR